MLALFGLALGLGFRHGYDLDHVVALADIAATRKGFRRSMVLSALYAAGHALIVAAFGILVIFIGASLPPALDKIATAAVGTTLLGMGFYVLAGVVRHGADVKLQSRGSLVLKLFRRRNPTFVEIVHEHEHGSDHGHVELDPLLADPEAAEAREATRVATKVKHSHLHAHVAPLPEDPMPAFSIGIAHGIGAETPTQIALFAAAAGSGRLIGSALVVTFLAGLFVANMIVATFANFSTSRISRWRAFVVVSSVAIGVSSVFVGASALLSL